VQGLAGARDAAETRGGREGAKQVNRRLEAFHVLILSQVHSHMD
jgi:hypothetical protein